jgi:hypothetical protein
MVGDIHRTLLCKEGGKEGRRGRGRGEVATFVDLLCQEGGREGRKEGGVEAGSWEG